MGPAEIDVFFTLGLAGLEDLLLAGNCVRGLAPLLLDGPDFGFGLLILGADMAPFGVPPLHSASSPLASTLSCGATKWVAVVRNIRLWLPSVSSFCLRAGGASSSLSLSASLVAPVEEAASAIPLKVSSSVEADVRPWDMLDIPPPRRISCMATSLSSSDMELATVGSGVGVMPRPGAIAPFAFPKLPRVRRDSSPGVAYMPGWA